MITAIITVVAIVAGLAFVMTANAWWAGKMRRNYLIEEYPEPERSRIIAREVWVGMTDRQLVDSQGDPRDKTLEHRDGKSFETYTYDKQRVFLENCLVTRWESAKERGASTA